jgi:sugar lactone lactonase YvrE
MHSADPRSAAREGEAPTLATSSRSAGKACMMPSQHVALPAWKTLLPGLAVGESPRWHEDRLWLSDWGAHESVAADPAGNSAAGVRTPCGLPCCIDGLPDGRLLRVSGSEHRRLRQEPAGSLVRHVDRRSRSEQR